MPGCDGIHLKSKAGGRLNSGYQRYRLVPDARALFDGDFGHDSADDTISQIFLHDHPELRLKIVELSHRQTGFEKEPRDIKICLFARIERLRIDAGHGRAAVPADAKILACRCVGG